MTRYCIVLATVITLIGSISLAAFHHHDLDDAWHTLLQKKHNEYETNCDAIHKFQNHDFTKNATDKLSLAYREDSFKIYSFFSKKSLVATISSRGSPQS